MPAVPTPSLTRNESGPVFSIRMSLTSITSHMFTTRSGCSTRNKYRFGSHSMTCVGSRRKIDTCESTEPTFCRDSSLNLSSGIAHTASSRVERDVLGPVSGLAACADCMHTRKRTATKSAAQPAFAPAGASARVCHWLCQRFDKRKRARAKPVAHAASGTGGLSAGVAGCHARSRDRAACVAVACAVCAGLPMRPSAQSRSTAVRCSSTESPQVSERSPRRRDSSTHSRDGQRSSTGSAGPF